MSIKVIVFDFDGTLVDSLSALVNITNRLASEFGYKPLAPDDLNLVRNLSSRQVIKQSGVSNFKIPFILNRVKQELRNDIEHLNPILGIKEVLINLNNQEYRLGILTSNSEVNVKAFLKCHEISNLFNFIYCGITIFGKNKAIKRMIKINNIRRDEIIYVGDETRDIEAAKKIPIKIVAVSWGFNSPEVLAKHQPDFLINQPTELIEVMARINKIEPR